MHASGFPGERIWSVVLLQFASDKMMIDEVGGGGSSATPYLSRPGTGRRPCKLRGREWKGAEGNGPRWHGAAGSQLAWIALAAADGLIWQHTGCACIVLRVCVCVCVCVWAEGQVYVFEKKWYGKFFALWSIIRVIN